MITLLSANNCFAQKFEVVVDESLYPVDSQIIPPPNSSELAVVKYTVSPYNTNQVVSADIIPFIARNELRNGTWGWYEQQIVNEPTTRTWYSIISADTLFSRTQNPSNILLASLQQCLVNKNLGTVTQRQNCIKLLNSTLNIDPLDFRVYLVK